MRSFFIEILIFVCLLQACSASERKSDEENDKQGEAKPSLSSEMAENIIIEEDNLVTDEKISIYQIMARLFGNKKQNNLEYGTIEQNGVGKFEDISEKALKEIKSMGITHVWYTGIIEHAVVADYREYGIALDDADVVKGRAGSPYAIKDYYDVNPDLAIDVKNRMKEFEALVTRTHQAGLKVIIDFVPNHVARLYVSDAKPKGVKDLGEDDNKAKAFHPNNNFYYLVGQKFQVPHNYIALGPNDTFINKDGHFEEFPAKVTGNDKFTHQPDINDWFETVKLNYGVDYQNHHQKHFYPIPSTWLKMRDILLYWADKDVDGFRCDMAEMVPVEFWNWVIPEVKKQYPAIVFIAEIYNPQQYRNFIERGKFDFLYDKVQLYDTLRNIMAGHGSTDFITPIWQHLKGINKNMLRFLENHDEQRIASPQFAGDASKGVPGMVISAALFNGPVMIYFGQEVGEPGAGKAGFSGEDGRTSIFDYWGVPEHQKWMNNGKFDGGLLTPKQKKLRDFYLRLLNFSIKSPAITKGRLIDTHQHNRAIQNAGYSDKMYSFVRDSGDEKLLIVTSFSNHSIPGLSVSISETAMQRMKLNQKKNLRFSLVFKEEPEAQEKASGILTSQKNTNSLEFTAQPFSAYIFKIEQ